MPLFLNHLCFGFSSDQSQKTSEAERKQNYSKSFIQLSTRMSEYDSYVLLQLVSLPYTAASN